MKKGFTVIELIIVALLFSIMIGVSTFLFITGLKAWSSGQTRTELRESATLAMERMVRDLSEASNITNADPDTITFSADVDNDSVNETVTLGLDGDDNLMRTVDGASVKLTPDAPQVFTLSYTDLNNNPITPNNQSQRDTVRVVTIALTMNKSGETYSLSSSAYTRNQGS